MDGIIELNCQIYKPFETGVNASLVADALFIHVHKCAGTSVKQLFSGFDNLHCKNDGGCLVQRHGGCEYCYAPVSWLRPEWSFSIVRHPFARVASCWAIWNYRRREGMTIEHAIHIASQHSILEQERSLSCDSHLWKHTRPTNWYGIDSIDVFRLESIATDWTTIRRKLGIDAELSLENPGIPHPHYSELFDHHQRSRLATIYRHDLDTFGYEP